MEINEMENKNQLRNINKIKYKVGSLKRKQTLPTPIQTDQVKKKNTQITKIRKETGDVTANRTEMK